MAALSLFVIRLTLPHQKCLHLLDETVSIIESREIDVKDKRKRMIEGQRDRKMSGTSYSNVVHLV